MVRMNNKTDQNGFKSLTSLGKANISTRQKSFTNILLNLEIGSNF
jgi:hypothetical protein